jgi:hypothetical protein
MKMLRSLVKVFALLFLVLWPVSALAANSTGDTGTACDPFASALGTTGSALPSSAFVLDPTVNSTVTSGSIETLCIPTASRDGDLIAVLDYSPANPITTDAFTDGIAARDAFSVTVHDASDNAIVTHWTPDQCQPGHDVFTLSASQMHDSGPFLLDVSNFSGFDVGYTMTVSGPGANGIPGANPTLTPSGACP